MGVFCENRNAGITSTHKEVSRFFPIGIQVDQLFTDILENCHLSNFPEILREKIKMVLLPN